MIMGLCKTLIKLTIVLALANPFSSAFANYLDDYQKAIKKIESRDWQGAVNLFEKIPEFNQQERASVKLNNGKSIAYLPKYYKGLALFYLDRCGDAEKNWISSIAQRTIVGFKDKHQLLLKQREVCKSRLVNGKYVNRLAKDTQLANRAANQYLQQHNQFNKLYRNELLKSITSKSAYLKQQKSHFDSQRRFVASKLSAFPLLPYSQSNQKSIQTFTKNVNSQTNQLKSHKSKLDNFIKQVKNIQSDIQAVNKGLTQLANLQSNKSFVEAKSARNNISSNIVKFKNTRKTLVEKSQVIMKIDNRSSLISNTKDAANLAIELNRLNKNINVLKRTAEKKIAEKNQILQKEKDLIYSGANAYFSGNYQNAIAILSNAEVKEIRGKFYQNLFIAAAHFHNPIVSETVAKEKAEPFVLKAKGLKIREDFDHKAFSPKFIAFYQQVTL